MHVSILRAGDYVAVLAAAYLGSGLSWGDLLDRVRIGAWEDAAGLAVAACGVILALAIGQAYRGLTALGRVQQISMGIGTVLLLESFFSYAAIPLQLDFHVTLAMCAWCGALLLAWYGVTRVIFPHSLPPLKILLAGDDPLLAQLERAFTARRGCVVATAPAGDFEELEAISRKLDPERIVVGFSGAPHGPALERLLEVSPAGAEFESAPGAYERLFRRVSLRHLPPDRLVFGSPAPKTTFLAVQAIYSNLAGLLAVVVTSPILLLAGVALKLSGPRRSAIEEIRCAGAQGIPFGLLRFESRSWLGQRLARLEVDRLPGLINVVRGELSLVGPRPHRLPCSEVLEQAVPCYRQRTTVKPGLTGWAQVHGCGEDLIEELEYDLFYVENVSPLFDLQILGTALLQGPRGRSKDAV